MILPGVVKWSVRWTHRDRRVPALDSLAIAAEKEVFDMHSLVKEDKMRAIEQPADLSIPKLQVTRDE